MANKTADGKYACSICNKIYGQLHEADACREKHDLIYLPLTRKELNDMLQFIYTQDEELLSEEMVKRIQKYVRSASLKPLTNTE